MTDTTVEFRILGLLEVRVGGNRLQLQGGRQETALAALLLDAGRVVTFDQLVDAVWDDPPRTARRQIQDLVTKLRRGIEVHGVRPRIITTHRSGYILTAQDGELDAHRFERLVAQSRDNAATDPTAAAELLRAALALCRGRTLAGITSRVLEPAMARWDEHVLTVQEELLAHELAMGNHPMLFKGLSALIGVHPLRERLVELLMITLQRSGRRTEALDAYRQLRQRLADSMGLDPSARLQELHRDILLGRATPPAAAATGAPPNVRGFHGSPARSRKLHRDVSRTVVEHAEPAIALKQPVFASTQHRAPAQLPPDIRGFSGRRSYLEKLDELLESWGQRPTAALACVIAGTAGVGKTALAVHWAHHARERFPDGQLYLNLRGFDPAESVTTANEAIHRLLTAIGVTPDRVPKDLDAQIALYRTELDGKRILLLLDNARDAEQVRCLLPGTASVLVLITSRDHLTSLVALNAAEQMVLDLFSHDEAMELLSARLGGSRVAIELSAAAAIVTRCARLPLALTVAAARAMQRSAPLQDIAGELADASARLSYLSAGDPHSELWSVFSWSYERLAPPVAALFRRLGLHCGPEISIPSAAALLAVPTAQVRPMLSALTAASLLTEEASGRYTFHDLLRDYAAALAEQHDSRDDRDLAVDRLLDHYRLTAYAADRLLRPLRDPVSQVASPPTVAAEPLSTSDQAMEWFTAEMPTLIAAVRLAISSTRDTHTWHLAWSLTTFLTRRGPWHGLIWAWHSALQAAERLHDPLMQADAHRHLTQGHTEQGNFGLARKHGSLALDLYAGLNHHPGSGHTHYALAILCDRQAEPTASLQHALTAYSHFVAAEHRSGQATALNGIGWCKALLGDFEGAFADCRQALSLMKQLGDEHGLADTWDTLGLVHHRVGQHSEAVRCYAAAIEIYQQSGDRYYEAATLMRLGDAHRAADQRDQASHAWQRSLLILIELDHPVAEQVADRLQDLAALETEAPRHLW